MLSRMISDPARSDQSTKQSLILKSSTLAAQLAMKRYYIRPDSAGQQQPPLLSFDPRFLVFEFTENLMLRESQVDLVEKMMSSYLRRESMVQQMIMGAGKTTVVGPLLALILGDGKHLVTQIVPQSLLDFSRGTMRATFSSLIRKPVYTFAFDRFHRVTPDPVQKAHQGARQPRGGLHHPLGRQVLQPEVRGDHTPAGSDEEHRGGGGEAGIQLQEVLWGGQGGQAQGAGGAGPARLRHEPQPAGWRSARRCCASSGRAHSSSTRSTSSSTHSSRSSTGP